MPLYEYSCKNCGEEFEMLLLKRDEKVECPCCNSGAVDKLMSACSFKSESGFTPASGTSSCGTCAGGNCSTCH